LSREWGAETSRIKHVCGVDKEVHEDDVEDHVSEVVGD
jgi:hypothetical protein